jgi:Nucleotidyl transferase AbiEii toxin, Type IV TA system
MFSNPLHNHVLTILRLLKADFLESCGVYFGGGTLLALNYAEYRLSRDIDFLCVYGTNFSRLRSAIYDEGVNAIFQPTWESAFQIPRELRTDRDGVRFSVAISDVILKFEIVAEGRISLDPPIYPHWSPVPCLSVVDQIAEKLLANGDRWADASTDSRDLIDLATLRLNIGRSSDGDDCWNSAIAKAESAYRSVDPLKRAILQFQSKPEYRDRCYERLCIQSPSQVVDGLDQLATQFNLPLTERLTLEIS